MWSPGGEEHCVAQCPHTVGCCQHFVCSVSRYSTILFAGTWKNLDTAVSHCTHPTHCCALIRKDFLSARVKLEEGKKESKERRWEAGEETVKWWVAEEYSLVSQSVDHWGLEYLRTLWVTAEAQTTTIGGGLHVLHWEKPPIPCTPCREYILQV